MSAAREELHRILKAVIHDLERDGYAREQIGSAMLVLGFTELFGEQEIQLLKLLRAARMAIAQQEAEALQ